MDDGPDPDAARHDLCTAVTELGPPLAEQALAHVRAFRPFLELNFVQLGLRETEGKVKELINYFIATPSWPEAVTDILASYDVPNSDDLRVIFDPMAELRERLRPLGSPSSRPTKTEMLDRIHAQLISAADNLTSLRRPALLPLQHPPRFARLCEEVTAESVTEKLTELVEEGRRQYEAALAGRVPRESPRVGTQSAHLLESVFITRDVFDHFRKIDRLVNAERNQWGASDQPDLRSEVYRRAAEEIHPRIHASCLAITLNYLQEVLKKMPEYAQDSGQGLRRDPVTVNGNVGTIGGVVTGQVFVATSIRDTTIGQSDLESAIHALIQEVQHAPGLAEERADLLNHIADIADIAEAADAPEAPRRLSRAKAALAAITAAAAPTNQLAQILQTWHDVFRKFGL